MQIVITVVGEDRPGLIVELTRVFKDCRCHIMESRMTKLGGEFAAHMLVDGNWNHIVKLENALEAFAARYQLKVQSVRASEETVEQENLIPYAVDIFAADQMENIHELATFFAGRNIRIIDVTTSRYPAPYSGAALFMAHMVVTIPAHVRIVSLRDEFLEFCDQQNLDAILEPVKR